MSFILLALAGLATMSCGDPSFVDKVTIANPYEYSVIVEVTDDRAGWLPLGSVDRESEKTIPQVIDMGERWVFRFTYPHAEIQSVEVSQTRSELAAARWRVQVPESLARTLRERGEPPSYEG